MFDPNYDPYEDLENCKEAIQQLGRAFEALVEANNVQATVIKKNEQRMDVLTRRLEAIQRQIAT